MAARDPCGDAYFWGVVDIYRQKNRWKIYLALFGIIIIAVSMLYTRYLTTRLAEEERKKVEVWRTAQIKFQEGQSGDFSLHEEIITSNTTIPLILVDEQGEIIEAVNFPDTSESYLVEQLEELRSTGPDPIEAYASRIYYSNSRLLKLLQYLPWLQLLLISAFIAAGYLGFSAARRAEQNRVWVGMAKETAHQLGTPITAILGWIESLRMSHEEDAETQDVLDELSNDLGRLELIAERFSKIGSEPELSPHNLVEQLDMAREYMQRRSSQHVRYTFPDREGPALYSPLNEPLFQWVIENIIRNALDAMEQQGEIHIALRREGAHARIDITDTGKGVPSRDHKRVFQPGFSTKTRGWGLGLSLADRIISVYHRGKIYISKSAPDKGSTFTIELPIADQN